MTGAASKAIAGCLALAAFTVAVLAGLASGNSATSILLRAVLAMIVCYPVGLLIGLVCGYVIDQHVAEQAGDGAPARPEQNDQNAEEAEDVLLV